MPYRALKRKLHLVDSRTLGDDGLRHVGFEYGGSTLCGRRMLTLDASEAKAASRARTVLRLPPGGRHGLHDRQPEVSEVRDPREEALHRLAESKGLAVSVTRSRSVGQHLVEIRVVDLKLSDRVLATFYTFTQAQDWIEARSGRTLI